jgi:hypothetical protein
MNCRPQVLLKSCFLVIRICICLSVMIGADKVIAKKAYVLLFNEVYKVCRCEFKTRDLLLRVCRS